MWDARFASAAYDTQQRSREQLPAGTYGDFVANGSCGFTLKIDGTRCPSMVRVDGKSPKASALIAVDPRPGTRFAPVSTPLLTRNIESAHALFIVNISNNPSRNKRRIRLPHSVYCTDAGTFLHGHAEEVLASPAAASLQETVDLIFTSPPFPLNRKKKYNNLQGDAYIRWLESFAPLFKKLLKPSGSIVMEVGNSWIAGKPIMSTLAMESLLAFLRSGQFKLCQQFVWQNPARLPSPAQWVTVERIRVKDSHTHLWWMSPNERPKADNRRVLTEYSASMKQLLKSGTYNSGARPSQHHIGKRSFLKNNNGAIPGSVIKADYAHATEAESVAAEVPSSVMEIINTHNATDYQKFCRKYEIVQHPARMPSALAEFFIRFLTEPGDVVLDPFGGSNTTGAAAEKLGRRWITVEPNLSYIAGSLGRFPHARPA